MSRTFAKTIMENVTQVQVPMWPIPCWQHLLPRPDTLGHELPILVVILILSLCTAQYISQKARKPALPLPPSPPARAWTGHIHLRLDNGHQCFDLLQRCGPLALLKHGPSFLFPFAPASTPASNILVLNTIEPAVELLERRGARYSSRPRSIAAGEHLSAERRMTMMPYGDRWRQLHRALAQVLSTKNVLNWRRAMEAESEQLLRELLTLPSNPNTPTDGANVIGFPAFITRFTASSALQLAYARRASTAADPVLSDLARVSALVTDTFKPGNYWVDRLPMLNHFPAWLSPWKRRLLAAHAIDLRINGGLIEDVRARLAAEAEDDATDIDSTSMGRVVPLSECSATMLINNANRFGLDNEDVIFLCAQLYEAGTETTGMTINTLILACAIYPDVCTRAQAELDATIPSGRLPTFDDLRQMPYMRALIRETLRLTPTANTGVGHVSTAEEDEEYEGLRIPAGCMVLASHYGIHHDPTNYPDPWRFAPERWFETDGEIVLDEMDPLPKGWHTASLDLTRGHRTFGFGRRICPGSHLASNSLGTVIPRILWAFTPRPTEAAYELARAHPPPPGYAPLLPGPNGLLEGLLDAHNVFNIGRADIGRCVRFEVRSEERARLIARLGEAA